MNDSLAQWLESCARVPGLLGCGVRRKDGGCTSTGFNASCPPTTVDEILKSMADCLPSFSTRGFVPNQLKWTFAGGQLVLVNRPDGILLGLVLQPDGSGARDLDLVAREFLALELAG
jgi:hypothetical protein